MIRVTKPTKLTLIASMTLIVAGLVVAGIATAHLVNVNNQKTSQIATDGTSPDFNALLPTGKSINDLGGWNKQTPPNGDVYYVFLDSVNGVSVRVTQQTLPDSLKDGTDTKITEIAKGFNATQTLQAGQIKAYIGTSAKGPQSIIFTQNELLVLIVSEKIIPDDAWIDYITSLT